MQVVTSINGGRLSGREVKRGEKAKVPSSHARLLARKGLVAIERPAKMSDEARKAAKAAKAKSPKAKPAKAKDTK